ncbi:hypothetical protein [Aliterella atlantica]|uniref:Uncharacterized protein n=1 Tax=Aliterella atlantica CENA595 TaxID=1618023 RepID=A0A0D8ZU38_9CYAN|nr:hypothetical protein [Aliterella atlantica]KJH71907.1 hypothetical protein UH38_09235 [Aliterella atlantica CENA595]
MQNSSPANLTIAKLLEVDADLAAQEVELSTQLQSLQEKRHSLKTVIAMFAPGDTATKPVEPKQLESSPAPVESPQIEDKPETTVGETELDEPAINTTKAPATPQKQQNKNSSSASSKQAKKPTATKKSSKEPETWHYYLQDEFSNATLAQAVSEVMQQQEDRVLDIATILKAIFVDEIPKAVRSTARERVSNVLSVGAKQGKWYRGQLGKYSMSKAALKNT